MKFKKFLKGITSITIIATPIVTTIACSSSRESAEEADLYIFGFKPEQQDQADLVAQNATSDLGFKVGWNMVGGSRNWKAELAAAFQKGNGPTIFPIENQADVTTNIERVYDFNSSNIGKELLLGVEDKILKNGEKIAAIPITVEAYGTLVNTKLLKEKYKITLAYDSEDNTWLNSDTLTFAQEQILHVHSLTTSEWSHLFNSIQAKESGDATKAFIFTLKVGFDWITNHLANAIAGAATKTRENFKVKKTNFLEVFPKNDFTSMMNAYHPFMSSTMSTDDAINSLALGLTVGNQQGSWMQSKVAAINSQIAKTHLALLPLPIRSGEGKIPVGIPSYWAIDKKAGASKIDKALKWLKWLYKGKGVKEVQNTLNWINPYSKNHPVTSNPVLVSTQKYINFKHTYPWVLDMLPVNFNSNNTKLTDAYRTFQATSGNTSDIDTLYNALQTEYTA